MGFWRAYIQVPFVMEKLMKFYCALLLDHAVTSNLEVSTTDGAYLVLCLGGNSLSLHNFCVWIIRLPTLVCLRDTIQQFPGCQA
jgi:hypothetical protein